jgi:hypothetical protein
MTRTTRIAPCNAIAAGIISCLAQGALAAGQNDIVLSHQDPTHSDLFTFDYGVPSSPALNLIGLSPDKTTVSSSLKPFVLSLPSLASGGADQSAALDVAPLWLLQDGQTIGYNEYITGPYAQRFEYRFRTELAVYTGNDGGGDVTKEKPSQIAVGFSVSLLDASDPLTVRMPGTSKTVWDSCLDDHDKDIALHPTVPAELQKPLDDAMKANNGEEIAKILLQIQATHKDEDAHSLTAVQACTTEANNYARFAPNLSVGAGANLQGDPGSLSGFNRASAVFWLSGKYPIGSILGSNKVPDTSDGGSTNNTNVPETSYWMVGGSGRVALDTLVATGDTATPQIEANTLNGWIGLERNSSWLVLSAQAGYQDISATKYAQDAFSRSGWRWMTSAALKLSSAENGIWLDASYGSARGTTQTLDDKTFMLSLHFGPANPANLFGENASK